MSGDGAADISRARHFGGFVLAGLAALTVDIAVLSALTDGLGVSPFLARLASISLAMVTSWQINRRVTFAMTLPATLSEFGRFAAVSWTAQAVNYTVFVAILLARPESWPAAAVAASSLVAMFVSYAGFRFGVFRN